MTTSKKLVPLTYKPYYDDLMLVLGPFSIPEDFESMAALSLSNS